MNQALDPWWAAWALATALGVIGAWASSPAGAEPAQPAVTGRVLFSAHGGVGMAPSPLPPGYETDFAAIVVELENRGPALDGFEVRAAALLDSRGTPIASLRRVAHLVTLPQLEAPGPTKGIFAVHLNPEGVPFRGRLERGRTILRARFSLDHGPSVVPARCRLELGAPGSALLVIEGPVNGSWPS